MKIINRIKIIAFIESSKNTLCIYILRSFLYHGVLYTFDLSALRRARTLAQQALDVRGNQLVVAQQVVDVHVIVVGHVRAGFRGKRR